MKGRAHDRRPHPHTRHDGRFDAAPGARPFHIQGTASRMSIAVFGDQTIDRVALLEEWAANPTPADLSPMYSVEEVDGRLVVTGPCAEKPGARSQVYCPPNFLHAEGKTRFALSNMAEQLNLGCRHIDVVMAHEATYHPDQVNW